MCKFMLVLSVEWMIFIKHGILKNANPKSNACVT